VRLWVCTTPSRKDENFCHASVPTCAADPSRIYHSVDYCHSHRKIDRQSSDCGEYLWRVGLRLKFFQLHNTTAMCSAILMLAFSIACHYAAADYIVMMAARAMMKRKSFTIFICCEIVKKREKYFSMKIKKISALLFNCKLFKLKRDRE
jgi:hypothetical protein